MRHLTDVQNKEDNLIKGVLDQRGYINARCIKKFFI
jgi:hypothetical protein